MKKQKVYTDKLETFKSRSYQVPRAFFNKLVMISEASGMGCCYVDCMELEDRFDDVDSMLYNTFSQNELAFLRKQSLKQGVTHFQQHTTL